MWVSVSQSWQLSILWTTTPIIPQPTLAWEPHCKQDREKNRTDSGIHKECQRTMQGTEKTGSDKTQRENTHRGYNNIFSYTKGGQVLLSIISMCRIRIPGFQLQKGKFLLNTIKSSQWKEQLSKGTSSHPTVVEFSSMDGFLEGLVSNWLECFNLNSVLGK